MVNFGRLVLFVVCAWFSMVPYAHLTACLTELRPAIHERAVAVRWIFFESLFPTVLVAMLVALPIAWIYGRAAPWVALALTVPFAAVRFVLIRPEAKALELVIAWSTIAAYVFFVTGVTWIARRLLVRRRIRSEAQAARTRP